MTRRTLHGFLRFRTHHLYILPHSALQFLGLPRPSPCRELFPEHQSIRRIATRYERLARNYPSLLCLVSAIIWLAGLIVNAPYTSQIDSRTGCLDGKRQGDRFYCSDGVVLQADQNAARNVLTWLSDPDVDRFTPFKKVKEILLERTEPLRLGLLNQDSSCSPERVLSTESESPNEHFRV